MVRVVTYMVDDDVQFLDAMRSWMEYEGVDGIQYYQSAEQLIARLHDPVHICILDHTLHGQMTGMNLMRRVMVEHPRCYFIILSGTDNIEVPIQFMNEGAHCFVRKAWPDFIDKLRHYIKLYIAKATKDINFAEQLRGNK